MKVLGIIGSLRQDSIHRTLFNHYQELCADSFSLEEGSIADIPLYNADIEGQPDAVSKLSNQIRQSDGVIFFSPEYNYSIPGTLKNALDWLSRVENQPLNNKPAAIIGASPGNIGTARMQYHLRQVGVFFNIRFLNKPEAMIGQAFSKIKDGRVVDEKTIEFLEKHANAFHEFM